MDIRLVLLMTNTFARNSLAARKANAGEKDGRKSNMMESPLKVFQHTLPKPHCSYQGDLVEVAGWTSV